MSVKFDLDLELVNRKLTALRNVSTVIIPPTFQYFKQITPRDTGYAQSQTTLAGNVIHANYPYAQVLNNGRVFSNGRMRGSKQAPNGMVEPTKQFFMKNLAKLLAQQIMRAK